MIARKGLAFLAHLFLAPARIKAYKQSSGLADRTGQPETAADSTAKGGRFDAAAFWDDGKHRFLNISGATTCSPLSATKAH